MKILYIMSSFNLYGGTPKKTLDLMNYFKERSVLYVYSNAGEKKYRKYFEETGGKIYVGSYGNNYYKHIKNLLEIIDEEKIDVIQTQFFKGEILGYLVKLFRPNVKLIIAFVSSQNFNNFKSLLQNIFYKKADAFIFISKYVKREKLKKYEILNNKKNYVVYNGTQIPKIYKKINLKHISLLSVSGLNKVKNLSVIIDALDILINRKHYKNIYFYIAGDGPERKNLENKIKNLKLEKNVFLLGYRDDVGSLLEACDIYVHPAYAEGFGIAVAEAMMMKKPIIVSNAGALPELIENNISGLYAEPFNAEDWANKIEFLIKNKDIANNLALNAEKRALEKFSVERFVRNYEKVYKEILGEN